MREGDGEELTEEEGSGVSGKGATSGLTTQGTNETPGAQTAQVAQAAQQPLEPDATGTLITSIIDDPAVVRRMEQRDTLDHITSNATIASAMMVAAAILAVMIANSPLYEVLEKLITTPAGFHFGTFSLSMTIEAFVNDGLMTLFFLLVGIELKYEMLVGQLRVPRQAALPMLAAVGGVIMPAVLYTLVNHGENASGWAIPIATDIAFALGVMSLLGDRIRPETKVFLQTLAIADDILAIVVLALFYGRTPDFVWLAATLAMVGMLFMLNVWHVFSLKPYTVAGIILWVCMYKSGIHATLSGVIIAFFLPARSDIRLTALQDWLDMWAITMGETYDKRSHVLDQHDFTEDAFVVERVMHHVTPPLERAERNISVLVNFAILPLFAFVNAQVRLVGVDPAAIISNPVAIGAFVGAVLGKPLGICAVTAALVKVGFAKLPRNMGWAQLVAVGILGGLGFTMSILIAGLAFSDRALELAAKCAILAGSVVSAALGIVYVRMTTSSQAAARKDAGGGRA